MKKFKASQKGPKRAKYNNTKVEIDGIVFDSKKESNRYVQLKLMQINGYIKGLEVHKIFPLFHADGTPIILDSGRQISYEADFVYCDDKLNPVVEDVKSSITKDIPYFKLKKCLFEKFYGLKISII